MNKIFGWAVLCGLVLAISGCNDAGMANDVTDLQEQGRLNQPVPGPTELPPGLGDDLPAPPATQPAISKQ